MAALTVTAACGGTKIDATNVSVVAPNVRAQPASVKDADPDERRGLTRDVVRLNCGKIKCVALTFDDGPMEDTGRLLKILDDYHAKATFFVVGTMVEEDPAMVQEEVAHGHEIANHSWDHSDLSRLSASGVRSQLKRTQDVVHKAAGVRPVLLRPPYGATNARVASAAKSFGMPQILWAVDPLDWKDHSSSVVARRVLANTRRGDVVLMHDIHPTTVSAVPKILASLSGRGFHFVTVSDLFAGAKLVPGHQYVERPPSKVKQQG
ncbi:polysaccharide deacetylase family protein [Actinocorallia longicatena]